MSRRTSDLSIDAWADVAGVDLYVGLFAFRYGHVPDTDNPDRRSITELEYRQGV
jgi:hypothetical protein